MSHVPQPIVRKVAPVYRCDRCSASEDDLRRDDPEARLRVVGDGRRLCFSCVLILVRLATV